MPQEPPTEEAAPMIEFPNVNKNYGEYRALVDIDAEAARGAAVNRLEEIHSGTITFDGRSVHEDERFRTQSLAEPG
jgi:polar amino acid transport system ATP-binding protein